MSAGSFEPGCTYDNVYFLFTDASGYSTIVGTNPRDLAAHLFDRLRDAIVARVEKLAAEHRCERAELWSWRGDGGCLVVHDEEESAALQVALRAGMAILTADLPELREELLRSGARGELHLRLAVHKGPIHYTPDGDTGAIHSPDINFAAHLEEVTPRDCLTISEDVHRVAGRLADQFEPGGTYEGKTVHLMSPDGEYGHGRRAWLRTAGLAGGLRLHAYAQRPSQPEKARLVDIAVDEVLDFGTALNTCAGYLVTTERPAHYRDAVLALLSRGGVYRCVLLDPDCEATALYSRLRHEDLAAKIRRSLDRFRAFKNRHGSAANGLQVHQTDEFPGIAALCADLRSRDPVVLYSPYMFTARPDGVRVERADMPHYLVTSEAGPLFTQLVQVIGDASAPKRTTRVL
ncbi:hypothetical protein E1293_31815 [Actinomadura darangshiensis]|uniref:Uncharacterized protein n=1 Tax=Actinomadura darangshiensis TaxID=705336 RepID=A0A4R5AK93_9ACTN|nr:adenylate/guanylate cyclase domain-containing protein [Actinomadura darangshiensis]TDD73288.1 hypothetical protein E1293_31815 [Actinomadura darangshiensis]